MARKILFVDDEPALLSSIERSFGFDYDLVTALSGELGLEAIDSKGPFEVIVSDMRMPGIDGVEFIRQAREVAPDSIFMMLTGNQDLETAAAAVNEAEVFRFINKPCNNDSLQVALEAALKCYDAMAAEKELLHKTFVGAVSAITTTLGHIAPDLADVGARLGNLVSDFCRLAKINERWEFKLAGRLAPLCFATCEDRKACLAALNTQQPDHLQAVREAAGSTAELFAKIPRLENVAEIIRRFPDADGGVCHFQPRANGAIRSVGASLLRVAMQVYYAQREGVTGAGLAEEVRKLSPDLPTELVDAIEQVEAPADLQGQEVCVTLLQPGMVLNEDLTHEGALLVRKGKRLGPDLIAKIADKFGGAYPRRVQVTTASYQAYADQMLAPA